MCLGLFILGCCFFFLSLFFSLFNFFLLIMGELVVLLSDLCISQLSFGLFIKNIATLEI